jgi:hypothetical protein
VLDGKAASAAIQCALKPKEPHLMRLLGGSFWGLIV